MSHATPHRAFSPPPRRVAPPGEPPSGPFWQSLTPQQREAILRPLGRLLARRLLTAPSSDKEVADERD
jgi:hypothetical protein